MSATESTNEGEEVQSVGQDDEGQNTGQQKLSKNQQRKLLRREMQLKHRPEKRYGSYDCICALTWPVLNSYILLYTVHSFNNDLQTTGALRVFISDGLHIKLQLHKIHYVRITKKVFI